MGVGEEGAHGHELRERLCVALEHAARARHTRHVELPADLQPRNRRSSAAAQLQAREEQRHMCQRARMRVLLRVFSRAVVAKVVC